MRRGNGDKNPTPHDRLMGIFRFLLVSSNIKAILQESTIHRREELLRKKTGGLWLGDAYNATIELIKIQSGDKSRLGMEALMWITHAERPLSPDELCHALAIELGSTSFNSRNVPSMPTLVACCQGLISVDEKRSTVRLIHSILQEYLSESPDIFIRPHSEMAEICLTYLNSEQIRALSVDSSPDTLDTPFLEYCSVYWGVHAKRELSDCASLLSLELLREYDGHISAKLLFEQADFLDPEDFSTFSPFSGLHCATFFGITEVVVALIERRCCDINAGDFGGHTSLTWAAHNGHDEVVKLLLDAEGVDPDRPNNCGETPLLYAARNGHEEIVKMLLKREEVNPDKSDNSGQTPLSRAAGNGHEGVVKVLLEPEEVNPDKADDSGLTPLAHAAWDAHEGVVKMLLERGEVNPDKPDNSGRTPLSLAAQSGRYGMVKILLRREDVNPHNLDNRGQTPSMLAAKFGYWRVVDLIRSHLAVYQDGN